MGIPALAAYHYFRAKIDRYVYEMEHISLEILEGVSREHRFDGEASLNSPEEVASPEHAIYEGETVESEKGSNQLDEETNDSSGSKGGDRAL